VVTLTSVRAVHAAVGCSRCIERQLRGALRADTEACTLKFKRVYRSEVGIFATDADTEAR
jgi:hypothetical protein